VAIESEDLTIETENEKEAVNETPRCSAAKKREHCGRTGDAQERVTHVKSRPRRKLRAFPRARRTAGVDGHCASVASSYSRCDEHNVPDLDLLDAGSTVPALFLATTIAIIAVVIAVVTGFASSASAAATLPAVLVAVGVFVITVNLCNTLRFNIQCNTLSTSRCSHSSHCSLTKLLYRYMINLQYTLRPLPMTAVTGR